MSKRPTNKQITRAANRLKFYEWSDLEVTELLRRLIGKRATRKYVDGMKAVCELAGISEHPRIKGIVEQAEKDCVEVPQLITSLN